MRIFPSGGNSCSITDGIFWIEVCAYLPITTSGMTKSATAEAELLYPRAKTILEN
ncbi:MAG: hypothetical protein GY702_18615 [Desulfobulbaceae bacterium]|nr:hypothetical protein [Desulfobulbaceae bacterium]